MAKFLNTTGISFQLEELINSTKDRLILISPYLQFSQRIKEHLHNLNIQKRDIRLVIRENGIHHNDFTWLENQIGIRTSICKNLHAKCYFNENQAIITSMNLYEFSQQQNNEMGISIKKELDFELYNSISQEVERLLRISDEIRLKGKFANHKQNDHTIKDDNLKITIDKNKPTGYCIRTGVKIPFNIEKPLCLEAYRIWNEHGNGEFKENYCHFSGELSNNMTCFNRPVLNKNWNKATAIHGVKIFGSS